MGFFDLFTRKKEKKPTSGHHKRYFNAARYDRFTAGWQTSNDDINKELNSDLDALRSRARDIVKNNEFGKKFRDMCVTNIIGPAGFQLQARSVTYVNGEAKPDDLDNDAIERAFALWAKRGVCEITGKLSFLGVTKLLIGTMPSDGEFLVRIVRGADAGNAWGFALQVIDVQRLATKLNRERTSNHNAIVMGIEVDQYQRPVNYWLKVGRDYEQVPADDMLHGYMPEHVSQLRGIPWAASSILTLHHLSKLEESAMLAARKGADTIGFFYTEDGEAPSLGGEDPVDDQPIEVSVPGSYDTLPDGVRFAANETRYPDNMLEGFIKTYQRRIANGFGVTYNGLSNDLEGVNFSSIRSGTIEERDRWMTLQSWFMESFLSVVYIEWLKTALLRGLITLPSGLPLPASKLEKFSRHHWQGRRWQWVDPAKDIAAARDAVKSGIASPQMIAAQQGVSVAEVLADIALFEKMSEGLSTINYGSGEKQAPPQEPAKEGEE